MKSDSTAWALWTASVAIPLVAHASGLSFTLKDIDGGAFWLLSPLWFVSWQPIIFVGLLTRSFEVLSLGLVANALAGGGLLLGSFIQLPLALIAPSDAIAATPRMEIAIMHGAAMLTGASCLAVVAHVGSPRKSRSDA